MRRVLLILLSMLGGILLCGYTITSYATAEVAPLLVVMALNPFYKTGGIKPLI
jgi:hypothetical protein